MKTTFTSLLLLLTFVFSTSAFGLTEKDTEPVKKKYITIKLDNGVKIKVEISHCIETDSPEHYKLWSDDTPEILEDPELDLELELIAEERLMNTEDEMVYDLQDEQMDMELEEYAEQKHMLLFDDSDEVLEDLELDKQLETMAEQRLDAQL
ncbi:MAG: hypothetical protein JXR19_00400 [Bacteroidia bacterium]